MKNLLELKASQKLGADHIVKAVLLDVGSPPPSEPDKQPIVLCLPPGDIKMGANLIGKHLHIDPAEKGKKIWITSQKEGAMYLSYFDDEKKHFLTIRDGVRFDFRPLDPSVKMHNPKDRLPYLADHYRACWDHAAVVMAGTAGADLTAIATALWLETKAGVTVPTSEVATPKPDKSPDKSPDPTPKAGPPPGKPPEDDAAVRDAQIQMCYMEYAKWDYSKLCENAAAAFKSISTKPVSLIKREAVIRLLDTTKQKEPKAWMDVYDDIWQSVDTEQQQALDNGVAAVIERNPGLSDSDVHKTVCLSYVELTKVNEPI
jgi:hypothetical protein